MQLKNQYISAKMNSAPIKRVITVVSALISMSTKLLKLKKF